MIQRARARRKGWPPSKAALHRLIAEATIDAYGECEQRTGFYTMLEEHLATPFGIEVLGVACLVDHVDISGDDRIIAIVRRGRRRQAIDILDLPIPDPPPLGAEWIEAYRAWARGQ